MPFAAVVPVLFDRTHCRLKVTHFRQQVEAPGVFVLAPDPQSADCDHAGLLLEVEEALNVGSAVSFSLLILLYANCAEFGDEGLHLGGCSLQLSEKGRFLDLVVTNPRPVTRCVDGEGPTHTLVNCHVFRRRATVLAVWSRSVMVVIRAGRARCLHWHFQ